MLLLYSERPTQANPNPKRLPATVIAEQDRRFLLVRERAQRYILPGGVLVKGGVLIQKKELSGHKWRNRKDPP